MDDSNTQSDLPHFAVTVYLAASTSVPQKYFELAHAMGAAIAEQKWLLV